jgi:UDP-N-acetylmuramoylalanine--D-glutamate ligase
LTESTPDVPQDGKRIIFVRSKLREAIVRSHLPMDRDSETERRGSAKRFRASEPSIGAIHRYQPCGRSAIRAAISNFRGLEHALQFVGELNGIKFINDSKATNVDSVRVALESLDNSIILIMGGYDKGNDYSPLVELVKAKVKRLILLGEHTAKIRDALGKHTNTYSASTMRDAVFLAYSQGEKGDYVLLSPANASFDLFTDYRERGNAFREAVKQLGDVYQ